MCSVVRLWPLQQLLHQAPTSLFQEFNPCGFLQGQRKETLLDCTRAAVNARTTAIVVSCAQCEGPGGCHGAAHVGHQRLMPLGKPSI